MLAGRLTAAHLNAAIEVGQWRHNDPLRSATIVDPRFGFMGTIAGSLADCEAAGGTFHPQIFGWMVHVRIHSRAPTI